MGESALPRAIDHGHPRFRRCLLVALCLHLLFLALVQWAMVRQQQAALSAVRVRFETTPSEPWSGAPSPVSPSAGQDQLALAPQPAAGPGSGPGGGMLEGGLPGLDWLPAFEGPGSDYLLGPGGGGPGKGAWSAGPTTELPSLAALELAVARRQMQDAFRRRGEWFPDPDTNSAERQRRHHAEAIVDSAIEAMGGLERLRDLRGKEVVTSSYDHQHQRWVETSRTWYSQGRKLLTRQGDALIQGTDGYRAWSYIFGMPMPVAPQALQQQAERWDFLSRFRGNGIRLDYLGPLLLPGGDTCEGILVEDLKYGTRRRACFDPQTHLLTWVEGDGGGREEVREYRRESGVLTPFATWTYIRESVIRTRLETRYNPDLNERFIDPGPRTWEPRAMRVLLDQSPARPYRVRLDGLSQVRVHVADPPEPSEERLTELSRRLLEFYVTQKLKAAGMLAEGETKADYALIVEVREFWLGKHHSADLHLLVRDLPAEAPLRKTILHQQWRLGPFQIDGPTAEDMTSELCAALGRLLAEQPSAEESR